MAVVFRRQLSMEEKDYRRYRGRTESEDRSSIGSSGSSEQGIIRSDSQCSLITKRSFLRKRIVELKELDSGIKAGCRAICFAENPQLGSIKWVGKINQIIYIGIEFDNPIGTSFPETKGAPPFPCRVQHGKLISQEDLILVTDPDGKTILTKEKPPDFETLQIPVSQMAKEFSTKLEEFHEFCVKAEDILDKLGGELDQNCCRRVGVDPISITVALERHKSYLSEVEDRYSLIDWCHSKCEELFTYDDVLLPSEERQINRAIQNLINMHKNIERKLKRRIRDLELALDTVQHVQVLLTEKLEWLTEAKAQLRYMEKFLIKTESQLFSRLSLTEDLLNTFSPTESDEIAEILEKIEQLHEVIGSSPELDANPNFDSQLRQIILMRSQLLEEIGTKYVVYTDATKSFKEFLKSVSAFELWYDHYMEVLCRSQADEFDNFQLNMKIVKERELKRDEFLKIFKIVGQLRVSIFDPSVLDDRLLSLQCKWRKLMDVCYQDKFRK